MGFEKKYNPKEKELEIRKFWIENNIFKFNEDTKKQTFSIDTPPPTISGKMHIGHAFSYTQSDFIARFKRMNNFEVFYPFGTDNNGLATEKLVQKECKVDLRKIERNEAIKIVNKYLEKERPKFIEDFKQIGLSCDFNLNYSTIDDHSRKISQKTFIELFNKGLIERKEGPVMWDRKFQTPIAQAELEDLERESYLNYIKAKIKGTENTYIIYATTRPELLFACVGISLEDKGNYIKLKINLENSQERENNNNENYNNNKIEYWIVSETTYKEKFSEFEFEIIEKIKGSNLIGEKATIPFSNKSFEITHDEAIDANFGTGIAYFCSYGGIEDIEWVARHKVKPINLINKYGKLNENGEKYEGLLAEEARKKIIFDLEKNGDLIKKEKKKQIVNIGERSGVEVEYIVTKQWYVNYLDKKEYFFEMAQKFNWKPEFMKYRLENWIKGLNWNWGFSRQRHFGIPIPVWYCKKCNKINFPELQKLPIDPTSSQPNSKCECGSKEFIPETDIMDTWFTSASSPSLAIELIKNKETKKKLFPMDLRPQAHDIINFWLFYTMAKNNLLYGVNPFKNITISGFVLDHKGNKMSKSKGNTISPKEIIQKYSNDGLRFASASTKLGNDIPFQEKEVQTGIKIVNKLYNANKFASMLLKNFTKKDKTFKLEDLNSIDKWIISKLQMVINDATLAFENYDASKAKQLFTEFFMHDIADNYIEIVKERLWKPEIYGENESKKAQKTLYYVLLNSLKGLSPIMPFITEEIFQIFYKNFEEENSIHISNWPEINKKFISEENIHLGDKYIEIITSVRKFKAEKQLSMKNELENITISCEPKLKQFIENSISDLKAVTSAKNIIFKIEKEKFKIEINLK